MENKVKNGITELVFILDKSGSMSGLEADTIGGFNAMIEKQRGEAGTAIVSTVLFSNESTVIHDRVPIEKVEKMDKKTYFVEGGTALLDAVGGAIHHIGNVHKYARNEDVPEHTVFVITTDGMENASYRYSYEKVKEMISCQEKKYGWQFLFAASNIDAAGEAARIGIRASHTAVYDCCKTDEFFSECAEVVAAYRGGKGIRASWSRDRKKDPKKVK